MMAEQNRIPLGLIEYLIAAGPLVWLVILLSMGIALGIFLSLIFAKTQRWPRILFALSLIPLMLGAFATVLSLMDLLVAITFDPAATAQELWGGLYVALSGSATGMVCGVPLIVAVLIVVAIKPVYVRGAANA